MTRTRRALLACTLLTFLDQSSTATTTEDVNAALAKALPSNLEALDSAEAQDSDAIVVPSQRAPSCLPPRGPVVSFRALWQGCP